MVFNIKEEDKNKSGIYQIRCKITGEIYIGACLRFRRRFTNHIYEINKRGRCYSLKKHVEIHGLENFIFELLEFTNQLKEREIFYIKELKPTLNVFLTTGNIFLNYKNGSLKGTKKKPHKRRTKAEMLLVK